jgi:stress response protein YsnF
MNAEKIRSIFNDRLVADDDAEAALRVEEVAQLAEANELATRRNSLLAELLKVQTEILKLQSENLDIARKGQEFALDPDLQGKHAFESQLGIQKAVANYNREHPLEQVAIAVAGNGGRR